ncbi:thymine dioxygenase [Aureobasidium pullulans]|uniref:Thymine dioxygenase n=1 Tax=Aureobasidium pullulans TaxID=5580 RepID=A0A4S9M1N8_AURPU|nr:thymine dioxygenase [Aureobasidium pullulans]
MASSTSIRSGIPIVNFAGWNDEHRRQQIAQDLVTACHDIGFVYIINHGIPEAVMDEAFDWIKKLFHLPHDQKMLAPHPPGPDVHRGYSYPGLEKVSQVYGRGADDDNISKALREVKDCKESYEIGSENNAFMPNVWLPEDTLPGFREFGLSFYWRCNAVAQTILTALAMGLELDSADALKKVHSGNYNQLRLLHYPAIRAEELEKQTSARMPAHTDWGSITLLFQDDCGGLQVEDPYEKGKFTDATPIKNGLMMNVGDMLMRWSNDYLKSTLHRVTLPRLSDRFEGEERLTRERYSIPYFLTPDMETVVQCMDECKNLTGPPKYEAIKAGEYLTMRAKLQYE